MAVVASLFAALFNLIWLVVIFTVVRSAISKSRTRQSEARDVTVTRTVSKSETRTTQNGRQLQTVTTPAGIQVTMAESVSGKQPQKGSAKGLKTPSPAEAKAKAQKTQAEKVKQSASMAQAERLERQELAAFKRERAKEQKKSYSALASILQEDRNHDWMARQKAEEARIYKHSQLDLGSAHAAACAADEVKKSHRHDPRGVFGMKD